jgi:hypothetical protein
MCMTIWWKTLHSKKITNPNEFGCGYYELLREISVQVRILADDSCRYKNYDETELLIHFSLFEGENRKLSFIRVYSPPFKCRDVISVKRKIDLPNIFFRWVTLVIRWNDISLFFQTCCHQHRVQDEILLDCLWKIDIPCK